MSKLDNIVDDLPNLSPKELANLRKQVGIYYKLSHQTTETEEYPAILDELLLQAAKKYVTVTITVDIIRKYNSFKMGEKFSAINKSLYEFAQQYQLTKQQTLKLLNLIVKLAVDKSQELHSTKSLPLLLNYLMDFGSLLEDAFPGYVSTELFKKFVLK